MPKGVYDRGTTRRKPGRPRKPTVEINEDDEALIIEAVDSFERAANRLADVLQGLHSDEIPRFVNFVYEPMNDTPTKEYVDGQSAFAVEQQPTLYVQRALKQLDFLLNDKGKQYATRGEFDNFLEQARIARISPRQTFRGALGQKLEREQTQNDNGYNSFDSIIDIAGYAVLWLAYELERRG